MDTDLRRFSPTVAEKAASAGGIRGDRRILKDEENSRARYDGSADGYDASFEEPFDALNSAKKHQIYKQRK